MRLCLIAMAVLMLFAPGARAAQIRLGQHVHWEADKNRSPEHYVAGPLTLTLHAREGREVPVAVLDVRSSDGAAGQDVGEEGYSVAPADFGVFQLDPQGQTPEVVFSTFTGGAHCCMRVDVMEQRGGAWSVIHLGLFDADPFPQAIRDVDGDGVTDIVLIDDAFDYTFDSFAGSWRPPRVFNIRNGQAWDVSGQLRYRALYRADMLKAEKACRSRADQRNGACAAFVADASRLGRFDWAWKVMLASYDRDDRWWPKDCSAPRVRGECPKGKAITHASYPDALKAFLQRTGYLDTSHADVPVPPDGEGLSR